MTDLTHAFRRLRMRPAFSITVVLTLALGIGANTVFFTLLNGLALRPLPVADADRLMRLQPVDREGRRGQLFSYPDVRDHRAQNDRLSDLIAFIPAIVAVTSESAQEALAYVVSGNYLPVLGARPALGRLLLPSDEDAGPHAPAVTVLSTRFWERRFGADPAIVGRTIAINGHAFLVVGVVAPDFVGTLPLSADLWVPIAAQPHVIPGPDLLEARDRDWLLVLGKLRAGESIARAGAHADVIAQRLARAYPSRERKPGAFVQRATFFSIDREAWAVIVGGMVAVGFVLIVACANVANLMLAQAVLRRREMALRLALGAARLRIVRELLIESSALSLAGGVAGLLLSWWGLAALSPLGRSWIPAEWGTVIFDLTPDLRVFAYAMALSTLAGVGFGLVPATHASNTSLTAALGDLHAGRGPGGLRIRSSVVSNALVSVQVMLAVVLLIGCALLIRASHRAGTLDLGFDTTNVVMTQYDLQRHGYDELRGADFTQRLTQSARALPGVERVALASHIPFTGGIRATNVRAISSGAGPATALTTRYVIVSPDYFATLGVAFARGRTFGARETSGAMPGAIISATLASQLWPDPSIDPIGQRVRVEVPHTPAEVDIIGVVEDTRSGSLWRTKEAAIYLPLTPSTDARRLTLLARGSASASTTTTAIVAGLQSVARRADPDVIFKARRLDEALALWILPSRVFAGTAAAISGLALTLAMIGVYGVLAYAVGRRTREIGVRIAIGATHGRVMWLVLTQGLRVVAAGLVLGVMASLWLAQALAPFLFGLSPADPIAIGVVCACLAVAALGACWVPARRATRVDPLTALRTE